jgi:hypothetical protein
MADSSTASSVNRRFGSTQRRCDELFESPVHPRDGASRTRLLKQELGIGVRNITKCCTEFRPEYIHITDNAIIPWKEGVVEVFYDPLWMEVRRICGATTD